MKLLSLVAVLLLSGCASIGTSVWVEGDGAFVPLAETVMYAHSKTCAKRGSTTEVRDFKTYASGRRYYTSTKFGAKSTCIPK